MKLGQKVEPCFITNVHALHLPAYSEELEQACRAPLTQIAVRNRLHDFMFRLGEKASTGGMRKHHTGEAFFDYAKQTWTKTR